MLKPSLLALALLACLAFASTAAHAAADEYFAIHVIDEATGRGVPLVEFEAMPRTRYYTDSNGYVAFFEPGLMNQDVWFTITSHGYEFDEKSFGKPGKALRVTPGGKAQLKIRRLNVAERIYRLTGYGIYRDTVLLGLEPPIKEPLLNGGVVGQDTTQTVLYNGKIFWIWGDTDRIGHWLGNFATTAATSELPGEGGLDPSVGVNLNYFTDPAKNFVRPLIPLKRPDSLPIWIDGMMVVKHPDGGKRIVARYIRAKDLKRVEQGLAVYHDDKQQFEPIAQVPPDSNRLAAWHPLRANVDGQEYFYFPVPYPTVRVKNDWASVTNPAAYEGFTCLTEGATYRREDPPLNRDAGGKLLWQWRSGAEPITMRQVEELISSGHIKRDETPFRLQDETGKPIALSSNASIYWNEYRKRWAMIGVQHYGDTVIGEAWFAESNAPEGPWVHARKVVTHFKKDNPQDFYNPLQHPYFAQDNGRVIYFEGTYGNNFSGTIVPTPYYDYNQLMYKLDLSDPRLKMPDPPEGFSNAKPSKLGS